MVSSVSIIHASEQPPAGTWHGSVFLAGPNPRDPKIQSWRVEAVNILRDLWTGPGTLAVFVPEGAGYKPLHYDRHEWENRWLSTVDVIAFWVPRNMVTMPALNTNIEFGRWEASGRMVFGAPPNAEHVSYMRECAKRKNAPVTDTLSATMSAAVAMIGTGQERSGAMRGIPLALWRAPGFAEWFAKHNDQSLDSVRLLWTESAPDGMQVKRWAIHAWLNDNEETYVGTGTGVLRLS